MHDRAILILMAVLVVAPWREAPGLPIAPPAAGAPAGGDGDAKAAAALPQAGKDIPRLRARELEPVRPEAGEAGGKPAGREGYLGVVTAAVSDDLRVQLDLPEDSGLVVRSVAPGSPAEKAGLEASDILLAFAGRKVTSLLDFSEMVQGTRGGTRVRLDIVRRGRRRTIDAVIEAREPLAGEDGRPGNAGQPGNVAGVPQFFNGPFNGQALEQQLQAQIGAAIAQGLAQAQAHAQVAGPGGTQFQTSTVTINGRTQSTTTATDAAGTIEIRVADGKRTVTVRDATGRQVHAGPLDKEADYKGVPEDWRRKVRDVEARSRGIPAGGFRGPGDAL